MSRPGRRLPSARRPTWWLGLLLGAWLAAQTLGLVHRELHGQGLGAAVQAAAGTAQAAGEGEGFQGHGASFDCRLYDHAGLADLLPCAAAPAPAAAALPGAPAYRSEAPRPRPAPPFRARGPPALS